MHPQAKWARERLIASGLDWKKFRIRTIRYTTKEDRRNYGDFGDAIIIPLHRYISDEEILSHKDAMLKNGLTLSVWKKDGKPAFINIINDGNGYYQERDFEDGDEAMAILNGHHVENNQ